jgi:uncharacterized damage-inducible protein DinB
MSWKELLKREIEQNYQVADALMDLVDDKDLRWKPPTGTNWMTTGQLLRHITDACGSAFRGFVTNDWGPALGGADPSQLSPEDMLPSAEKMPAVSSVREAKQLLREDKKVALAMLEKTTEQDLAERPAPAPWDQSRMILGHRLLQMVDHLNQHKGQLFYYLKLQGKPVDTGHLWGP